jgi:hydrogenase maturation protease
MATGRSRCVVIAIGNPGRGDDGAGHEVVRLIRKNGPSHVEAVEASADAMTLIAHLNGTSSAYVVDACVSGATPGTVRRFDVRCTPLPQDANSVSTHGLGLAQGLELASTLAMLPSRCIVYAIEGASFETEAPLSPSVARAAADVARRIREEIEADAREKREAKCTNPH